MNEAIAKHYSIKKQALAHLKRVEPRLGQLMDKVGRVERGIEPDAFTALCSSIVYQQLSFAAANTIWARFCILAEQITPPRIKQLSQQAMRDCGLSFQKINYINNIADAFLAGSLTQGFFNTASDKEILDELIKIKGVGVWTAEMFLMFCLAHEDVFSYGDLALRKGMAWLYGLKDDPTPAFAQAVTKKWSPYNTTACLYLWELTIQNRLNSTANAHLYPHLAVKQGQTGYLQTPVGGLMLVSAPQGLQQIAFASNVKDSQDSCPIIVEAKKQLDAYFAGRLKAFNLPLAVEGTDFQALTWAGLQTVPYGQTLSYGALAARIGHKGASRAVGGANNKNRLPIVVPCHRVTNANGKLGGYAGGAKIKQQLLALEQQHA